MSDETYRTGRGMARTGHGTLIPTQEAFRWAGGDYRLLTVAINTMRGITAYGTTRRLFTENQRLVLAATQGGCTFPGCDTPPARCEVHHLTDHAQGGPTSIDNAALVCSYNHRHFTDQGWQPTIINGKIG